jgi:hypothetical protein
MESKTEIELTGIYLDKEPIFFEEGGVPCFLEWQRWLASRRRSHQLRLRISMVHQEPIKHINVTITRASLR